MNNFEESKKKWKKIIEGHNLLNTFSKSVKLKKDVEDERFNSNLLFEGEELCGELSSGFLLWEDDPCRWGGPFENAKGETFCELSIKDMNFDRFTKERGGLKKISEVWQDWKRSVDHCGHSVPNSLLKKLGWEYGSSYWNRIHPKSGNICSYFGSMTEEEVNKLKMVATEYELFEWDFNKARDLIRSRDCWPTNCASLENPIKVSLYGNDDCSYTRFLSWNNKELIYELINFFIHPDWHRLERLGFFFSN